MGRPVAALQEDEDIGSAEVRAGIGALVGMEREIARRLADGENSKSIAHSVGSSEATIYYLSRRADFQAAVRALILRRLQVDAPALALNTLMAIAQDAAAPKAARVMAANSLLDRSGFVAKGAADTPGGQALNEMTFAQLEAKIAEMAKAKKDIEADDHAIDVEARTIPQDDPFS